MMIIIITQQISNKHPPQTPAMMAMLVVDSKAEEVSEEVSETKKGGREMKRQRQPSAGTLEIERLQFPNNQVLVVGAIEHGPLYALSRVPDSQ
jgi:hypothetical protein